MRLFIFGLIIGAAIVLGLWQIHETNLVAKYDRMLYEATNVTIDEEC